MRIRSSKFWITVLIALAIVAVASQLYDFYVWNVYYDTLPAAPDEPRGRVYADNFHGFVRYETRAEHLRLQILEYVSEGLAVIVILGAATYEWSARRCRHSRKQVL